MLRRIRTWSEISYVAPHLYNVINAHKSRIKARVARIPRMIISTYISTKFRRARSRDPSARVHIYAGGSIYIQGGKSVLVDSRACKRTFTRVTYDVPQVTLCTGEGKGGHRAPIKRALRLCTCPAMCTVLYDANTLTTPAMLVLELHIKY